MADIMSREDRSALMARIRGKHTAPELAVRRHLHRAGLRFALHASELPGRPDLVLPRWRTVVFVHGCFWHRHPGCSYATNPASNRDFWQRKFDTNVERDRRKARELRALGWRVFTVWECGLDPRSLDGLVRRIRREPAAAVWSAKGRGTGRAGGGDRSRRLPRGPLRD